MQNESLQQTLDKLRSFSQSPKEQGMLFEKLMKGYFTENPIYKDRFSKVWHWGEWATENRVSAQDRGIDLVAEKEDGALCAIQCKFYNPDYQIEKQHIDSFFTATGKIYNGKRFSERVIVSTTSRWGSNAEDAIKDQVIPCNRIDISRLHKDIEWDEFVNLPATAEKKEERPYQKKAIDDVLTGFQQADRGKLIMACGTGKTFISLKIAEKLVNANGGTCLFLVPSLALLSQVMQEWVANKSRPLRLFAVCSDTKAGKDSEDIRLHDLIIPATTNSESLAAGLRQNPQQGDGAINAIFATYHSIDVVAKAQQEIGKELDLIICDEAHRTTGIEQATEKTSPFTKVHNPDYLRARKRLYMTATPRIYTESAKTKADNYEMEVFSMDEVATYGEEFHRLGFSDAVKLDVLSDYKVMIFIVNKEGLGKEPSGELDMDDNAKIIGCWKGLAKDFADGKNPAEDTGETDKEPMKRAVAFTDRIKTSKQIAEFFPQIIEKYKEWKPEEEEGETLACDVKHVDGTDNILVRNRRLDWLRAEPKAHHCNILSNVRCLSEGVDVPALDAVMFLNPRNSDVDIVQSIGRVMRKAKGKKYGYILLPVGIEPSEEPEKVLEQNQYNTIWKVLKALRAHDDRFNAEINKIELNQKPSDRINIFKVPPEEDSDKEVASVADAIAKQLPLFKGYEDAIYAKIVQKCGDKRYWEQWAEDVGKIAQQNIKDIRRLVENLADGEKKISFDNFLGGLRKNINDAISEEDAIEMLAQHIITEPVFNALFENYDFAAHNPVSKAMHKMLSQLGEAELAQNSKKLEPFYQSIKERAAGIDNLEARQKIIIELYENFFTTAFSKMAERLGIVYTPIEVVDFILRSTDKLLRQEFGQSLGSKDIHILDPFTGTGTFITRMLQSDLIKDQDLKHKYLKELNANEIVLLAYYIAAINIEQAYHSRQQELSKDSYQSFPGIVLTDTFHISETDGSFGSAMFPDNSQRVSQQKKQDIKVIIGNPPYSSWQRSANDANANLTYPNLDNRVRESYAAYSTVTNKNSLYDSYIRAIRWASDRIKDNGIVAYVTNGGYIDGNATDGLRKCLADEFSSIYCFNLRGNTRTSGELCRKEGGKVFGQGSRATIAILFLIKNSAAQESKCKLHYYDIGDYLTREEKLTKIKEFGSLAQIPWKKIAPDEHNDWINLRNPKFTTYLPMGHKENKGISAASIPSIFSLYSRGINTARDEWVYDFSPDAVQENMKRMIDFYNKEVERYEQEGRNRSSTQQIQAFVDNDKTKIKWDGSLQQSLVRKKKSGFSNNRIRSSIYRPFIKKQLYFDRQFNAGVYLQPRFFPTPEVENELICVTGKGGGDYFSALMVNQVPNVHIVSTSQCFPRWTYQKLSEGGLYETNQAETENYERIDNIPAATVQSFQQKYKDATINGDAIFYYVYGVLHNISYKCEFASDLKKMLPHIPYASNKNDFWQFSKIGEKLAKWHSHYEEVKHYPLHINEKNKTDDKNYYRVNKMRFGGKARNPDKTYIQYNKNIIIDGIPLEAYDYIVNGKSAIDWIVESYQKVEKDNNTISDPNSYSDNSRYIINLIKKVVQLSIDTVAEVKKLPKLKE